MNMTVYEGRDFVEEHAHEKAVCNREGHVQGDGPCTKV